MASHGYISRKTSKNANYISTRKFFKVNKDIGREPKSALIETSINNTHQSVLSSSSSSSSSSLKHHKETKSRQPLVNQNYSSRNSLRAAQTRPNVLNNSDQQKSLPQVSPRLLGSMDIYTLNLERGIAPTDQYDILNSDSFIRIIGDFIYCMLCGQRERLQGDDGTEIHLSSERHNYNFCKLRFALLNQLPKDSSLQMNALNELLTKWSLQALGQDIVSKRYKIVEEFEWIVGLINPECHCRLVGSLMVGNSLVSSDINLELLHPKSDLFESDPRSKNSMHHKLSNPDAKYGEQVNLHTLHYDLIPNAVDTLYKIMDAINSRYHNTPTMNFSVTSQLSDLNSKVPKLMLRHLLTKTTLEVTCYAESSHKLAVLLRTYLSLDRRAHDLSVLVKHWAKLCKIDNPDQGTYPPDAYVILVIYYLQRTSPPVLPCLHDSIFKGSKSEENHKEFVDGLVDKMEKLELHANTYKNETMDINIESVDSDQVDNLLDVEDENNDDEEEEDCDYVDVDNEEIKNLNWRSSNTMPVHKLFVDFLRSMIDEFNNLPEIITIRTLKRVTLRSKGWGTQVKAIENPIKPSVNISRCIGTCRTFEFIRRCFRLGYYYLTSIPIDARLKAKVETHYDPADFIELYINKERLNSYFRFKEASIKAKSSYDAINEMIKQELFARDVEVINVLFDQVEYGSADIRLLPSTVSNFYSENFLAPNDFNATLFCWLCRRNGHIKQKCPRGRLENLEQEAKYYDENLDIAVNLDSYFIKHYENDMIKPELSKQHRRVVKELTEMINTGTGLNCCLELFGSTVNNLGNFDSDLDICMTLKGNLTGKDVDCVEILQKVHEVLLKHNSKIYNVEPILSARVPIIKFKFRHFDVDLSMYNQCATYNSRLLKTYSLIDKRVAQLFYLVKRYAKVSSRATIEFEACRI